MAKPRQSDHPPVIVQPRPDIQGDRFPSDPLLTGGVTTNGLYDSPRNCLAATIVRCTHQALPSVPVRPWAIRGTHDLHVMSCHVMSCHVMSYPPTRRLCGIPYPFPPAALGSGLPSALGSLVLLQTCSFRKQWKHRAWASSHLAWWLEMLLFTIARLAGGPSIATGPNRAPCCGPDPGSSLAPPSQLLLLPCP